MVNFFGELTDLVSSVTTVVKEVSQEMVNDVKKGAAATTANNKENSHKKTRQQQQQPSSRRPSALASNGKDARPGKRRNTSSTTTSHTTSRRSIPSSLDLHYITDRLLVMPQPTVDAWTAQTYFDQLKKKQKPSSADGKTNATATAESDNAEIEVGNPQEEQQDASMPSMMFPTNPEHPQQHRNDVTVLAEFLLEGNSSSSTTTSSNNTTFKVFNVSDTPAEETIVKALRGQVVQCPWKSPAAPRSDTPNMSAMLETVYAMQAFLQNNNNNKVVVYCANGKTRSALVVACYLAFVGQARTVMEGFVTFLQQTTTPNLPMSRHDAITLWDQACPPSLHTFGRNFTQTCCSSALNNDGDAMIPTSLGGERWGLYRNPKPLLLRAIALQGIPVEDKPCVDIWDGQQRHIYSSHPELWTDLVDTSVVSPAILEEEDDEFGELGEQDDCMTDTVPTAPLPPENSLQSPTVIPEDVLLAAKELKLPSDSDHNLVTPEKAEITVQQGPLHEKQQQASQWADEEGFYRVNVVLEGDFCLLCRFGGMHANSDLDPTKVLFRYANTTVAMGAGGPYELPPSQVDLMRRYATSFDPDDFLCTLLLEAHWNVPEPHWQTRLNRECQQLPPIYGAYDVRAWQRGWKLLGKYSVVQPNKDEVKKLLQDCRSSHQVVEDSDQPQNNNGASRINVTAQLAKLCLQQSNLNVEDAITALNSLTNHPTDSDSSLSRLQEILSYVPPTPKALPPAVVNNDDDESIEEEAQNILDILDSIDFEDDYGDSQDSHRPPPTVLPQQMPQSSKACAPPGAVYSSMFLPMPRQGDIVSAFGEYYHDIHQRSANSALPSRQLDVSKPLAMGTSFPQVPLQFPSGKNMEQRARHPMYSPVDDPANASAVELLLKMNHPGIHLRDLTQLLEESRQWNVRKEIPAIKKEEEKKDDNTVVAMGTGGAVATTGEQQPAAGPAPPIKDHPEFSKYFKMMKVGTPMEAVKEALKKDGKDPTIADLDPEKSLSSQRPSMASQEVLATGTAPNAIANAQKSLQEALMKKMGGPKTNIVLPKGDGSEKEKEVKLNPQEMLMAALNKNKASAEVDKSDEGISLRADPEYAKYFKMLKMGMPTAQIQHAMTRDEKDPTIIELDPERSLIAQRPPPESKGGDDGPHLKDDPDYTKYFKMLKMGMAKEQVAHALQRDGKDPKVLELDPNKSLSSQQKSEGSADEGPPLKDDEEYKKYFKMLKMGMAKEQVTHAVQRDGKDPAVLDMDPNKSLASQQAKKDDDGPPLKDDPEFKKYFKMLSMGLPKDAVKNALVRDGKDPSIMDLDPDKSVKSQTGGGEEAKDDGPPLKEDPEFKKYFKMLTMGLPKDAVKNALVRDGKDPSIMDLDHDKSLKSQTGGGDAPKDEAPPLKDDPEYKKYFKMLIMGLPKDAVKNALVRDGKDPAIMDLDPEKSVASQMGGGGAEEKDTGVPLKEDPEYSKYFKMLNMGLPKDAVKNALVRDGKDPATMDLDPTKSLQFQAKKKSGSGAIHRAPSKKKKKVRRKKIYWNPLEEEKIKEDSIWNLTRGSVMMDNLNYDIKEFEDLFTESADPADRKKNKKTKTDSKQKKSVQVIDGKRSMNGGIVLARMKVEYSVIAKAVNEMYVILLCRLHCL